MNILQSIFTDYYEPIIYKLHPRPSVIENVNKMIHCGDPSHGGAMYGCPHCGNKYNQLRCFHMSCKLVSCVHRHCEMESSYPLVHLFVKLKMKCTPDTKTTKLLLKLFLLWTSSRN
ncbi:MAG: transposase zinc-binding domain-containing protein [Roseburia inulinivorans]|uniref:transposase zinc-binding domain-containing protein n=1 Tax=Roseburia inulinivorans TaxID=360807 RepID=UPI0021BA5A75